MGVRHGGETGEAGHGFLCQGSNPGEFDEKRVGGDPACAGDALNQVQGAVARRAGLDLGADGRIDLLDLRLDLAQAGAGSLFEERRGATVFRTYDEITPRKAEIAVLMPGGVRRGAAGFPA